MISLLLLFVRPELGPKSYRTRTIVDGTFDFNLVLCYFIIFFLLELRRTPKLCGYSERAQNRNSQNVCGSAIVGKAVDANFIFRMLLHRR
jgi:hypothetical protein